MPSSGPVETHAPPPGERRASEARDLATIYREHAASVSRWARRLAGPRADAEDLLHEVFLVVQRRLPEFRGDAQISTWLYAITVRVVQTQRRKTRWMSLFGLEHARAAATPTPATPLEAFESRRASEITYALLDTLQEAERSALILYELEDLSGDEIAAITGEAVGTIWVRLHRARARFRKAYVKLEQHLARARKKETP